MTRGRISHLFAFLLLGQFAFSQDLIINFTDPPSLTVCTEHTFEFTLTNVSTNTLNGVTTTVSTPTGLEYIPGTVTTGTEQNISNPTAPIFSFPSIGPSETVTFTIGTELKCPLVTSINSGVLFTNIITANWNGGTNSITTNPYLIETPLLVITDVTNTVASGTQGDVIVRTITIQNTRLGALSSFTFSDAHGGGISISSPLGTVTNSTPMSFTMELTSADFMTIGDGDGLFEKDEIIVITENVLIVDCGITIPSTNSLYSISWGCYTDVCQTEVFPALIDIIPSEVNPQLVFDLQTDLPADYCGGQDAQQSLTITNTGIFEAVDVVIDLFVGLTINPITGQFEPLYNGGMDPTSFMIDSAGVNMTTTPTLLEFPTDFDCNMPDGYFQKAQFQWPTIGAGESVTLFWDYAYCQSGCNQAIPTIEFAFRYLNNCPVELEAGSGTNLFDYDLIASGLRDSIFYFFGEPLTTGNEYDLNYVLKSTKLLGTGVLNIEFDLPCGIGWGGSDLEMGGVFPFDVDISNTGGNTKVIAQYQLPMNADSVTLAFDVTFECGLPCGSGGECVDPFITSTGELACGTTSIINMEVSLLENPSVTLDCALKVCREIPLGVQCDAEFPGPGTGDLAFLFFDTEFERCNFGSPDTDDNRLPDPTGDLNFNLVRKDRAIPGDTVTTVLRGSFLFPTGQFPVDVDMMTVQFEAHTSDQGLNGGVALDFEINGHLMAEEGVEPLSAELRIVDVSSGQVFQCDIGNPMDQIDSIREDFTIVNTEPTQIIDKILYRQYKYNTTRANMSCLPPGFEYDQGDSIILITKHKMIYNPRPQGLGLPPIINMRNAVVPVFCNNFNIYISALPEVHERWQYSGYLYDILPGTYHALPCDPFSSPGDIGARFVLGENNFFPFEYRALASLQKWQLNFPDVMNVLESKLLMLRYQQGDNVFFNENLDISINPPYLDFDVAGFHTPVLDEGWEMLFFHEFDFDCTVSNFASTSFNVEFLLNPCLPEPSLVDTVENNDVFLDVSPDINLGVTLANFSGFDNMAMWDLVMINPATGINLPADNSWLQPVSATGLMNNFQLINTNTGQMIPQINGIFQLGTIGLNEIQDYQLIATNASCEVEVITLNYGWDCTPYTSVGQVPCRSESIILTANSPNGELEMDITSPVGPFDLCEEMDYHSVEIFNAQLGNVYDVFLELTIPLGLQIVPGSCQISFPTGSAFVNIPDPTSIAGNVFEWNVSALNSIIESEGLAGVSQDPNNSVTIRFKTTTECGFIAGSQIIFNTIGEQNCKEPTNTITRAGEEIDVTGIEPLYSSDVNVGINTSTAITCGAEVNLVINILPDGATNNSDSVLITLPPGVTYVQGSYNPLSNAPNNSPIVIDNAGQQILKIEIPSGVAALSLISFEVGTTGYGAFGCGDQVIQILAVQRQEAICTTTGEACYVLAQTGGSTITISSDHPDLDLQNFEVTANGNNIDYSIDVSNAGVATSPPLQVDFYLDNDGDGTFSSGDTFVGSDVYNSPIDLGGTITVSGTFAGASLDELCNLIAVIDEENNCLCGTETIQVNSPVNSLLPTQAACSGIPLEIGIPSVAGHIYQWDPPMHLASTTSSSTTFQFVNTNADSTSFNYTLIEQGATCEVHHSITINVFPFIGETTQDIEGCEGDQVTLVVSQGNSGDLVWEGPQITDPTQTTQTITLTQDTFYNVTIALAPGCEGSEEINITVFPTFSEDKYGICPGDSVEVDGVVYYESNQTCETMVSSFGCDSTHCVTIEAVDTPMVDLVADITIAEGDEITLEATPGFSNYEWSPSGGLSCSNCPNPTVTLTETTNYSLTVTDEFGCISNIFTLVTVFPPCSPQRLLLPNVFTPDKDGDNDEFGITAFEGFEMITSIKIFNRWGEKIFEDAGAEAMWDGTQKGKAAPMDTYVYVIKVECEEGIEVLHGDVTLVR